MDSNFYRRASVITVMYKIKLPAKKIGGEFFYYVYSILFLDDGYFIGSVGTADGISAIVGENNLSACFDRNL